MKLSVFSSKRCRRAAAIVGCVAASAGWAAPQSSVQTEVQVVEAVSSRPLRDVLREMPQQPGARPDAVLQPVPNRILKFGDFRPLVFNESRAPQPPLNVPAPLPALNFLALRSGQPNVGGFFPPDTTADISDVHILQMVNVGWALFNKTTGATVSGPNPGNSFWQSFPAGNNCRDNNDGDPIVLWDKVASRWVVSQFSVEAPFSQCFAVSKSGDPLGEYWLYEFVYPNFNDYGKMGLWVTEDGSQNAYLLTMHEFVDPAGGPFVGSSFAAVERDKMLVGQPAKFIRTLGGDFGMVPLHLDGAQKLPSGACPSFVHREDNGTGYLFWDYCLNWAASTATLANSDGTVVPSELFNVLLPTDPDPVQRDANIPLDSFKDNTMYRPAVLAFGANGPSEAFAVVTHTVNAGTAAAPKAGARWVQFALARGQAPSDPLALLKNGFESPLGNAPLVKRVINQGIVSPDASGRFMTAGAMDQIGNVAIGFTATGPNLPTGINPEVRYTARRFSDPAGTMMEEQSCTPNGVNGPYTGGAQAGRPSRRWGDYSMVAIDPVDRCTFYVTNEYSQAGSPGAWASRICSFKFDDCGTGNFLLEIPAEPLKVCTANPRGGSVRAVSLGNFTGAIALTATGFPAGITPSFSPASISSGGQAFITLGGVASAAAGVYSGTVTGTSGPLVRNATLNYEVATALPTAVSSLQTPTSGNSVALTLERFNWTGGGGAGTEFFIEIARDAAFTQIFESARLTQTTYANSRAFALGTQYFWRVTALNACGAGTPSATNSFTTVTSVTACPAGTTSTIVFSDDVSTTTVPWVVSQDSGPVTSEWRRAIPPAGTGFTTQAWFAGNSEVTADQFLTSPAINVPATGSVLFGFDAYTQYETVGTGPNCWDGGSVEVSIGAGAFEPIGNGRNLANPYLGRRDARTTAPRTEAWCVQATPGAPVRTVFSLNDYRGQSIRLRYRSTADTNTVGPVPNGMAVDNVQVLGCQ